MVSVMALKDVIYKTITENFRPEQLEVIDESHLHAGHAGNTMNGESHFLVKVSSSAFQDMSRVAREKLLHKTIADAIQCEIHAMRFQFI